MIRIGLADDHPLVREGLRAVLSREGDLEVVTEAVDFPSFLRQAHDEPVDVWVLDVSMPGGSILAALDQVAAWSPSFRVLVLTVHPEDHLAVRILRAGAAGYLTKDKAPEELVAALHRVHGGRRYLSPGLAETLLTMLDEPDGPPHERLSDREFAVMLRLARGERPTDIARGLGLSVKTVSTYRSRVLDKLSVATNADLVRYALDHDLLSAS